MLLSTKVGMLLAMGGGVTSLVGDVMEILPTLPPTAFSYHHIQYPLRYSSRC